MLHLNLKAGLVKMVTMLIFCSTALPFIGKTGGDTYTIYLNKTLVTKQYVGLATSEIKNLQLSRANYNDQIIINYSHCGAVGKERKIVVKDDKNIVLKEWKFSDAEGSDASMKIAVKEILNLQKNSNGTLKLYYFSAQYLPKGRMLTSITMPEKNVAQAKI